MNRRIVLIDEIETPNYMSYFGIGLGSEIYTIQTLKNMDYPTRTGILDLGEGDAAMLVGSEPFTYLRKFYHYGVRSENYYDCSELPRLSISGGAFVKVIVDFPSPEVIQEFMNPSFCEIPDYGWFNSGIIHTYERAMVFLDWVDNLPENEDLGFDYEGSGFPLDKWYELSGFSLCNIQFGAFVSLTDIRHELGVPDTESSTNEKYNFLRKRLAEILYKRMAHIFVYNMQYEYQASHRLLYYVDLYDLCDVSAINVITGHHLKKYSLKWSGQLYLKALTWDFEFDYLSDIIDRMLFIEVGKLKKDKKKVLRVEKDTFEQTSEWAEICKRYPEYIDEFRSLILEYWGNPFMCIPSDILGKYCNLDAFYTLLIYKSQEKNYTKECFDTFFDNFRLGTRLHTGGLYINEPYRLAYDTYCKKQMTFGIQYCAMARCWMKMQKHKTKMADISKYPKISQKLLKDGKFFQGDTVEIIKYILSTNIDSLGATDTGLDEGQLAMTYGFDFAGALVDMVKIRMKEIKMKTKLDSGVIRKKKLLGLLAEDIKPLLGLDKVKIGTKHIELEKYSYYERNYKEMERVSRSQLNNPDNIPEEVYAFGQKMSVYDYSRYILANLFMCTSPEENDEIAYEYMELFKPQTCFLASILESSQQLPNAEKFYSERGITDIDTAFQEYLNEGDMYYPHVTATKIWGGKIKYSSSWHSALYPDKVFNLTIDHSKSMKTSKKITKSGTSTVYELGDKVKEIWTDFNGFNAQSMFFPQVLNEWEEYGKPFKPEDYNDTFFFMRKFVLMYLLFKKHDKMLSTYVGETGMFNKTAKYVIEDEHHIPIREAEPGEPGAVKKTFIKYQVNEKSSKRWSSGFHTIVSHSDIKNCLAVPPSWNSDGSINYGGGDFLMTYFDISSAEVKAAGFASGDPDLIDKFNKGEDIYIYSAKLYLGDKFDSLSKKDKKMWRKRFKTIFLGVLYGLGKSSLAERLECSIQEAEDIIQGLYKSFPQLRVYVGKQQKYCLEHQGYVNTMLGDKLQVQEYEWWLKTNSEGEKKNLEARMERLGVNLPIQGGTSSIMARGFENNIRVSHQEGWKQPLQPIIVVHDSNTNYVPIEKIFDIRHFYDVNYTDYCASFGPKIKLLFDLLVGESYESACEMKSIDKDTIEFSGSADSLIKIYDKLMRLSWVKCNTSRENLIPDYVQNSIKRFILEGGTSMIKDLSNYTIQFHREENKMVS